MASNSTERVRRLRLHRKDDHSLCLTGNCEAAGSVTAAVSPAPETPATQRPPREASPAPDEPELGTRGRRLWRQVTADGPELQPGERVLLEETCRAADRLDQLDRILRGDEDAWMRLHSRNEDGSIVQVVLNNALAEARQQQTTLARLLAELRQTRAVPAGKPKGTQRPAPPAGQGEGVAAGVFDLTARIADLRNQATG